jgi:polygalacturonase
MYKRILLCLLFVALNIASRSAVYNIMDFGAISNGTDLTTIHIQKAIDKCFLDGGGVVMFQKGNTWWVL